MALAFGNGHSDLVDVLVKLYGCSISDAEKVNHVTPDNIPLSCMSLMGWSVVMFCHSLCLHLNISSHTSLPLLVIVLQTYFMNSEI